MCRAEPDMKERGQSGRGTPEQQVQRLEAGRPHEAELRDCRAWGEDGRAEEVRLTSQRQSLGGERAWGFVWPGLVGSVPGQTALELPCPGPVSGLLQVPICAILPAPGCVSF